MTESDRESEFEEIDQGDSQENNSVNSSAPKAKRRSKNDVGERNFKCGCGKDYLSYPALYTHIKQKHGGQQPNGTDTSTMRSHRGRGRPRKQNFPTVSTPRPPGDDSFLKKEGLIGGPCDPVSDFPESSHDIGIDKLLEAVRCAYQDDVRQEQPTCDEVFGMYLVDLAKKTTVDGYHLFVLFVRALRNCLNSHGEKQCERERVSEEERNQEFCDVQTAQNLPEISNYFITEYIEEQVEGLDREKAIGMMLHFNSFLFAKKFSNLKLSLIAGDSS